MESVTLEGEFIRLIPLSLSHHSSLSEICLDKELWRFTTNQILTAGEMLEYIEAALQDQAEGTCLPFVIVEKAHGTIVGSTRYHSFNAQHRRVVIGHTWIAGDWQRTAVNTETKYVMLKHAFEELHCRRVEFIVNSINEKSRRALWRIGATEDGILRNYVVDKNNDTCNVAVYSIIDSEWPTVKAELQLKLARGQTPSQSDLESSYDRIAAEYRVEYGDELTNKPFDCRMLNWLIDKVNGLGSICDMGCGPGQVAKYLNAQRAEACGVDLSAEMIRQAHLLSPEIRFVQGDMLSLDNIADSSLGGIAAFYSLVHIPRKFMVQALTEFKRVLRPDGTLLVTHHIGSGLVHREEWFGKPVSLDFLFFEIEEMKNYIKSAGLVLEEVIQREPYSEFEYPSQRAYIFARKR